MTKLIKKVKKDNRYGNEAILTVNEWLEVVLKEVPDTMTDEEVINEFLEDPYKFNPIVEGEFVWGRGRKEHKFGKYMLLSENDNGGFFEETSNDLEDLIIIAKRSYDWLSKYDQVRTSYFIRDLNEEVIWELTAEEVF